MGVARGSPQLRFVSGSWEPRVHLTPFGQTRGHFNVLRGLPSELALVTLFDAQTGAPTAIVDATLTTEARTGAVTALGARHLARRDSRVLGHIGARGTAWVEHRDARRPPRLRAAPDQPSRRAESREDFAPRLSEHLGKPVRAVATPEEALVGADIMVEASCLTEPAVLLRTAWVQPGTFVVPHGTVSAVELSLLDVMDKVVVDDWGQASAGPFGALRAHVHSGLLTRETLHAELGDVVAGTAVGRKRDDERILFWHRGLAIADLAAAHLIVERAEQAGIGTVLDYH